MKSIFEETLDNFCEEIEEIRGRIFRDQSTQFWLDFDEKTNPIFFETISNGYIKKDNFTRALLNQNLQSDSCALKLELEAQLKKLAQNFESLLRAKCI